MSQTPQPAAPSWFETWVLPYFDHALLWPVLFAVLGHFVVLWVPTLLSIYRNGSIPAFLFLLVSLGASGALISFELRARHRPGLMTGSLILSWALTAYGAYFCQQTGVL